MTSKSINRREALEKLAKCSVYTAPTVVTLLSANPSYAQGSGVNGTTCGGMDNRNPMNPNYPNAFDAGGNSNSVNNPNSMVYTNNTVADCGNAS